MAISLELPKKFAMNIDQARQAALEVFRPISRKYDLAEHAYPVELDTLAALYDGLSAAGQAGAGAAGGRADAEKKRPEGVVVNGGNMQSIINSLEASYGDVGLMLSLPFQGPGQRGHRRRRHRRAARAPGQGVGVDGDHRAELRLRLGRRHRDRHPSTATSTSSTARRSSSPQVRVPTIVVWASVDRSLGRAAIKSFVVPREHPGVTVVRLEEKLGIRASDTAVIRFEDCRIPAGNLLGSPRSTSRRASAGSCRPSTTPARWWPRWPSASAGPRWRSCAGSRGERHRDRLRPSRDRPARRRRGVHPLESDWEASYLLTMRAAWMADNKQPNSLEASMSKAKAGRTVNDG